MGDDPRLTPLGQFTPEGYLTAGYGDHYLFFAGRDDLHGILLTLLTGETMTLKLSMYGYDDEQLNTAIVNHLGNPMVRVQLTLDKSQAGGVHEKRILDQDAKLGPDWFNSVAVGQSATHSILHTKGGVCVGQGVWFEGSTNWSADGEGAGVALHGEQPAGFKAQANTLLVSTNPVGGSRFGARMDTEHLVALRQQTAAH